MALTADTKYLVSLALVAGAERGQVGGKAKHLAAMLSAGFPVPPAYAITTSAYRDFVASPSVAAPLANLRSMVAEGGAQDELQACFDELAGAMLSETLSPELSRDLQGVLDELLAEVGELAVRSSGTLEDSADMTFSGMLSSIIGVRTMKELEEAVKRCWLSASKPRVLEYARTCGIASRALDVAVVLQRLIPAERAGLVFTRDPVNRYARGVVVEATLGQGESLVSGEITPERYLYLPRDERVVLVRSAADSQRAGEAVPTEERRRLSDSDVAELSRWGLAAERLFGAPQDIEWVYGEGRFWILQSRPLVLSSRDERVFFPQVAEETVLASGIGASPKVGSGEVVLATVDVPQKAEGSVVVLKRLTNDLAVQLRDAAAVVADEGGATSHGANLLREFGVPAVISTGDATQRLRTGMKVTVDGFRGKVFEGDLAASVDTFRGAPETQMQVFVSVLVPEKAAVVAPFADGVSSLRDDYFLLRSGVHPLEMIRRGQAEELEETIYDGIGRTAGAFEGKPVWYKLMDAPTDEFRRLAGGEQEPQERNPLLGWRGIGRELVEQEMLDVELKAVARAVCDGHTGLGVKLPFVRFGCELERAKEAVRRVGLVPGRDVSVGISVETPATAMRLDEFLAAGVDFVSVGLSDLTMCTLALDRESGFVADGFDPAHPAVLELLERIVVSARKAGVFACATGESARAEQVLPHIVRLGYDAIGVSVAYFGETKRRIRDIEAGSEPAAST